MSMQGGEEMEFGKQIKKLRQEAQLSQEELAERIYVSRQTISNWENDKSYPDVNSLVLLSETFQISLDKLIKGDIEVMKDVIQKEEIEKIYGNSVSDSVIIQYGGSVKSSNAKELFEMSDIDGGLVGGASLKADEFAKIVNYK